ncbi:MAG TPA: hypothetical protein VER96_35495 [Polyangiaceae bacterium]|nr:hypothetical protein [Polyangiaceae bacterium]
MAFGRVALRLEATRTSLRANLCQAPTTYFPRNAEIRFHLEGADYQVSRTAITLECAFDGAAGAGVVSRALLSSLKEMSPTGSIDANLSSELEATTIVSGLTITTRSHQEPAMPNHNLSVTLK